MKITKITYSMGMTVNIGDYESVRVDYSAESVLDDSDSEPVAFKELKDIVSSRVRQEVKSIRRRVEEMSNG